MQKPLRRGIFVLMDNRNKWWISFKYEKLPMFFFGCGRVGYCLSDSNELNPVEKIKIREDPPYMMALKAEFNLIRKESIKFNDFSKKVRDQCSYTDGSEVEVIKDKITGEVNSLKGMMHRRLQLSGEEKMMKK
ncbi:hypothetical protein Godav_002631 [Gossypium davidsonii]|uniref:Zinc knuckle CX2CX4HX4C domain-containing protein n=1 Tax=Gossypium davidsonii TaxID=34287 RepID=A0A7J8SYE0_GOSDV|nr:hypothetical protein [Gossypium davidsonii]